MFRRVGTGDLSEVHCPRATFRDPFGVGLGLRTAGTVIEPAPNNVGEEGKASSLIHKGPS